MPRLPHPRTALSGLVDGQLGPLRTWSVRRHLRRCNRCALEVAQIRSLRGLLAAPQPPDPSPELLSRLLDIGGAGAPVPARPVPGLRPVRHRSGARAAGVLVAGVVLVGAAGAGAVITSPPEAWQGPGPRASLTTVLPRLWSGPSEPAGAVSVRPVDNGSRP